MHNHKPYGRERVKTKKYANKWKSSVQVLAFVYRKHIDFPKAHLFENDCITTKNFYEVIYTLAGAKIHLDHSDVTGEIYGFVHDFGNWKVMENTQRCVVFAHNLFGFDFYFFVNGVSLSVSGTKDVSVGKKSLSSVNFASVRS